MNENYFQNERNLGQRRNSTITWDSNRQMYVETALGFSFDIVSLLCKDSNNAINSNLNSNILKTFGLY